MGGLYGAIANVTAPGRVPTDIVGVIAPTRWADAVVKYADPDQPSDFEPSYSGTDENRNFVQAPNEGFSAITVAQRTAMHFALTGNSAAAAGFSVEGFTNLDLSYVGNVREAQIRVANSSDPISAYGKTPGTALSSGDAWIGPSARTPTPGNYSWYTMLHELGHTLGLDHAHEAGVGYGAVTAEHNSFEYTLMTYAPYVGADTTKPLLTGNYFPQTYMMLDIAALQYLYGADFSVNSDDTVYSWNPVTGATLVNGVIAIQPAVNKIFGTIWDGGGADTYDLSNYTTDLQIDLRPGMHSVFDQAQLAAIGGPNNGGLARGNIFNALQYTNWLGAAPYVADPRSLIESASGGSGADRIVGNAAGNGLSGGSGNDTLFGLDGEDLLLGSGGDDQLDGGLGQDILVGGAGADRLIVRDPAHIVANELYSGNGFGPNDLDTDILWVQGAGTFDFQGATLADLQALAFRGSSANRVHLGSDQFLSSGLAQGTISGENGFSNFFVVFASGNGNAVDLRGLSFDAWELGVDAVGVSGSTAADTIYGSSQSDLIAGGEENDRIGGGGGLDIVYGDAGDDTLDGGAGDDWMIGGAGNDWYFVDNPADSARELAGQGTGDRVFASVSWTMTAGSEIELVSTTDNAGISAINFTGNEFNNTIYGNAGPNTLDGKDGRDVLIALGGDDFYYAAGTNSVVEAVGGGNDRVFASTTYVLRGASEVERMSTTDNAGTAPINLTGSNQAETIYGNAGPNQLDGQGGADTLVGLGGDDWFFVDNAGDAVSEAVGGGNDRVYSRDSWTLTAGAEVELLATGNHSGTGAISLTGNALVNTVYGNAGNNVIDGGGGADALVGQGGNDWYYVDSLSDSIVEGVGGGTDTVFARNTYVLTGGAEVESLYTASTGGLAAIDLTGNEFANIVYGNAGANILNGKGGADTLTGSGGPDRFVFDTAVGAANIDVIADFASGSDQIALARAVFASLPPGSALGGGNFVLGLTPIDGDDVILYDRPTGQLFYDFDGAGGNAAVQFAQLTANAALAVTDFLII